jgi:hypothetical protein
MYHSTCFAFYFNILYTKYEIPQAEKYQVRRTNVYNNYIVVNKNFID